MKYMKKMSFQEFEQHLAAGDAMTILDVRNPDEFARGHLEGAVNVPLHLLPLKHPDVFPNKDALIVTCCMRGGRAGQAAQFFSDAGYHNVAMLEGGYFGYMEHKESQA